jgi:hypothetical protein
VSPRLRHSGNDGRAERRACFDRQANRFAGRRLSEDIARPEATFGLLVTLVTILKVKNFIYNCNKLMLQV